MRTRLVIFACSLALVLPATALAVGAARGDGTLSLKNANAAKLIIRAHGAVLGRFDTGRLVLTDHVPDDGGAPVLVGCEIETPVNEKTTICSGKNVRFRSIGGKFTLRITNVSDLDLSAVGRGDVTLQGRGTQNDGRYSFDGEPYAELPIMSRAFPLGQSLTITP